MKTLKTISNWAKLLSVCYLFILTIMLENDNITFKLVIIEASIIAVALVILQLVVCLASKKLKDNGEDEDY